MAPGRRVVANISAPWRPVRLCMSVLSGPPPAPPGPPLPPRTAAQPPPRGHKPHGAWPWSPEAGQYLAMRGSSSNMVSSTLRYLFFSLNNLRDESRWCSGAGTAAAPLLDRGLSAPGPVALGALGRGSGGAGTPRLDGPPRRDPEPAVSPQSLANGDLPRFSVGAGGLCEGQGLARDGVANLGKKGPEATPTEEPGEGRVIGKGRTPCVGRTRTFA